MASYKIFGFEIRKSGEMPALTSPVQNDGAIENEVSASGASAYGYFFDLNKRLTNEVDLINKYRGMSQVAEIDAAIEDIVNEAVVVEDDKPPVAISIRAEENDIPEQIVEAISDEFNSVLTLLDFHDNGHELFRQWYVDGKLYAQIIANEEDLSAGIQDIRLLDPRKIKKVRDIIRKKNAGGVDVVVATEEYFVYNEQGTQTGGTGIKLSPDTIIYANSGLADEYNNPISYLHKCITGDGRIRTPNGWKFMRDIAIGDSVYSYDPSNKLVKTTVTEKWNNGSKEIVEVRSRHTSFKCTADHLVMVYDKKLDNVSYVQAQNLVPKQHQLILPRQDFGVAIPFPKSDRGIRVKLVENEFSNLDIGNKRQLIRDIVAATNIKENTVRGFLYGKYAMLSDVAEQILSHVPAKLDTVEKLDGYCINEVTIQDKFVTKEFAKLFGFLIGDGCVNKNTISFSESIYPEMNEYYANLIRQYFGSCNRVNSGANGGKRISQYSGYQCANTLGCEMLKSMGFITGATKKRIPEWVFLATSDIKIAFIEGLMDADGSNSSERFGVDWAYRTNLANELLVSDIKELWLSLGLCSGKIGTVKQKATTINGVEVKKLSGAWSIAISKETLPLYENVVSVESCGEDIVYDIEVSSELHNFVVNGTVVHNCIKPANQLRYMEDAALIYTLSRAPSRRVFYIDIADMPKAKADQYMQNIMAKYKNKIGYDSATGEIRDERVHTTIMEDYWLPRRAGGRATEIQTLPSENITGQMDNVNYFLNKLYGALNIPLSRLRPDANFSLGRTQEITRDEIKFSKFIDRLRKRFTAVFLQALRVQLVLKGIIAPEDWDFIRSRITFDFLRDNYFTELKETEILSNRLQMAEQVLPLVGTYYSQDFVRRNILRQTDEEIEKMREENAQDAEMMQKQQPEPNQKEEENE